MKHEPENNRELLNARRNEELELKKMHEYVISELLSKYELEHNNDHFWIAKIEFSKTLSELINEYRQILD